MAILSILEPTRCTADGEPRSDRTGPPVVPPVVGADLRVPLAGGGTIGYASLDHAASAPALVAVRDAVDQALASYASVHRGSGWASQVTTAWYEQARDEVARFVGARPQDEVVFTRQTTDALCLLAHSLPTDTHVFVFDSEHHANLLTWPADRTTRLGIPRSGRALLRTLGEALRSAPNGPRLVCVAGASNVTGELLPVAEVAALAHAHGARVCLDAAQLAPHRPVDISSSDIDYVAVSGHKLYAPFGAGALVGRADWLDAAPAYLPGGGAATSVTADAVSWATGADRHEGGSPNVVGAVALAAACATLRRHQDAVALHEVRLSTRLRQRLSQIDGVRLLATFSPSRDRVGTVAFTVAGYPSDLVATYCSAEYGIGVRAGKFCAHQLTDSLLAEPDPFGAGNRHDPAGHNPGDDSEGHVRAGELDGHDRAAAVRASIGLASTTEHVDRLVDAIRTLVQGGPRLEYRRTVDGWVVEGDRRRLPSRPW